MNFSRISAISGKAAYAKFAVIYGLNETKGFVKEHKRFGYERQFKGEWHLAIALPAISWHC
jgi:hypothetical protein